VRGEEAILLGEVESGGRTEEEEVEEAFVEVEVERYDSRSRSCRCDCLRVGECSRRTDTEEGRCVMGVGKGLLDEEGNGSP